MLEKNNIYVKIIRCSPSQEPANQGFTGEANIVPLFAEFTETTNSSILADSQTHQIQATGRLNDIALCIQPYSTSAKCEKNIITAATPGNEPTATCSRAIEATLSSNDSDSDAFDESLASCMTVESEEVLEKAEDEQVIPSAQSTNPNESSAAVETSTIPQDESNVFTTKVLEKLLKFSEEGKEILQCAAKAELSDDKQQELATIIAKHHLKTRSKLLTEDLRKYALAVTSLFKFERLVSAFFCDKNKNQVFFNS